MVQPAYYGYYSQVLYPPPPWFHSQDGVLKLVVPIHSSNEKLKEVQIG